MIVINPDTNLEKFFSELAETRYALLILDYDGTLAPFSPDPMHAYPYPGISDKIKAIMQLKQTKVVILSGRELQTLKLLLNVEPPPELWGSHGGERLKVNQQNTFVKNMDPNIKNVLAIAVDDAQSLAPDLHCEVKPLSVALHWRNKDPGMAQQQSCNVLEKWKKNILGHHLEIHAFDGGIELRPQGVNKGEAVKTLLEEIPQDTMIAYLGDDFTDEEAFESLGKRALKILTSKTIRPTKADIQIAPPDELFWFLDQWIQSRQEI